MTSSSTCRSCLLLSLAWMGAIGVLCWLNWPHVPLDMSPLDPSTIVALRGAILRHVALYAAIALLPPLLAWVIARSRSGPQS